MLLADATVRLQSYTASSEDPVLTTDEVTRLLLDNRIPDSEGRAPNETNWDGAWNLAQAAVDGWLIKAGKASNRFNFGSDVSNFQRRQIHEMCVANAQEWARQSITSLSIGVAAMYDPVIGNLNGGN